MSSYRHIHMVNSYDQADSYSAGDGLDHFPGYLRFKCKEAQDTKGKGIPLLFNAKLFKG